MKRRAGFSLVELLVVISIIAILSGLSFAAMGSVKRSVKRSQTQSVLAKVDAALRSFRSDFGFYPKSEAAKPPYAYESGGYNYGDIQIDAGTGLPITANDEVWAATSPTTWAVGNGLFTRLGTNLSTTDSAQAKTNATIMREIEMERFYHIGSVCDYTCSGLSRPGGWHQGVWSVTLTNYKDWAFYDPVPWNAAMATNGEKELKRVFDHFRFSPVIFDTSSTPFTTRLQGDTAVANLGNEGPAGTTRVWSLTSQFLTNDIQNYLAYARPRDASDAYLRVLRQGSKAASFNYDSPFDGTTHLALANGALVGRTSSITTASKAWCCDYIDDIEPRFRANVDGKKDEAGNDLIDILDGYGNPLVYVAEGLPSTKRISPRLASIASNPTLNQIFSGQSPAENFLIYHPDPDAEDPKVMNPNTVTHFVTDKSNQVGVQTRPDAPDIAIISSYFTYLNSWIFSKYGYEITLNGDPYTLAGSLLPHRMRYAETPTVTRGTERFLCLSSDQTTLVEPFQDSNGNGQRDATEPFIDQIRNGTYDSQITGADGRVRYNDLRTSATQGYESEFELWSAGPDGRFHAERKHAANADNISPRTRK